MIFAYHGYPLLIHRLTYRRTNHANIHVRGYKEEGTTTTPFDMVMLNDLDRFHLVMDVIDRVPGLAERAAHLRQHMIDERLRHRAYTREHGDDPPELRNWTWPADLGPNPARRMSPRHIPPLARMRVLVVNAGSSTLKLRLLDGEDAVLAERELPGSGDELDAGLCDGARLAAQPTRMRSVIGSCTAASASAEP